MAAALQVPARVVLYFRPGCGALEQSVDIRTSAAAAAAAAAATAAAATAAATPRVLGNAAFMGFHENITSSAITSSFGKVGSLIGARCPWRATPFTVKTIP